MDRKPRLTVVESPPQPLPVRWWRAAVKEVRTRPFAYTVLAVFVVAGPFAARWAFPEAPPGVGLVGGAFLGVWAAFCAVPDKFY